MSNAELLGTYVRLRQELGQAYAAPVWNEGQINRLADEIVRVERSLASQQPVDEQTEDALLGVLPIQGQDNPEPEQAVG